MHLKNRCLPPVARHRSLKRSELQRWASRSYFGTDRERRFKDESSEVHGYEMVMLAPAIKAEVAQPEPVWSNPMGDLGGYPS